jgi:hypothetical protein
MADEVVMHHLQEENGTGKNSHPAKRVALAIRRVQVGVQLARDFDTGKKENTHHPEPTCERA